MSIQFSPHTLIDPADSILIVIDVQPAFLDKLSRSTLSDQNSPTPHLKEPRWDRNVLDSEQLVNRICWLVRLANWCEIPLIVTGEELDEQPLETNLLATLPINTTIFNKAIFGLAQQPNILAAVEQTERKSAILIGLETDVCVLHSALGLLALGYRVMVVTDATGSPAPNHELGLNRMQQAGVTLVNIKRIFYEWLRTVEMVNRFHRENPDMRAAAGVEL